MMEATAYTSEYSDMFHVPDATYQQITEYIQRLGNPGDIQVIILMDDKVRFTLVYVDRDRFMFAARNLFTERTSTLLDNDYPDQNERLEILGDPESGFTYTYQTIPKDTALATIQHYVKTRKLPSGLTWTQDLGDLVEASAEDIDEASDENSEK